MSKKIKPVTIDAISMWHMNKPKYNAYKSGCGIYGKSKCSRKQKCKIDWSKDDR